MMQVRKGWIPIKIKPVDRLWRRGDAKLLDNDQGVGDRDDSYNLDNNIDPVIPT